MRLSLLQNAVLLPALACCLLPAACRKDDDEKPDTPSAPRLLQVTTGPSETDTDYSTAYEYHADGTLRQSTYVIDLPQLQQTVVTTFTYRNGLPATAASDNGTRLAYHYQGRLLTKVEEYDSNNQQTDYITLSYKGDTLKQSQHFEKQAGGWLERQRVLYSYHASGNLAAAAFYDHDEGSGAVQHSTTAVYLEYDNRKAPPPVMAGTFPASPNNCTRLQLRDKNNKVLSEAFPAYTYNAEGYTLRQETRRGSAISITKYTYQP